MAKFLKFEKESCMPCRKMNKIFETLKVEDKIQHIDINTEEGKKLAEVYNISSVPTLVKNATNSEYEVLVGINHSLTEFKRFLEIE